MNGIERIAATLQGKSIDRRAVCLILPLYGARLTGCGLTEHYTDPAAYARGQSAVLETFQPDVLFGPFSLPLEGAAFGSEVRFFDNQAPNLARPAIASADEIGRLVMPDADDHPGLAYFREVIRRMSGEHGHEVPIAAIVAGPTDLPAMILGIDGWMETLLFEPEAARRMLGLTISHSVRWINALLSDGAMFAVLPVDFANPRMVSREVAYEVAIPALRETLSQLDGPVFLHSGGSPLAPFLDLFTGLPNVAGFVVNGGDSLAEARTNPGPMPVLIGNIDGPTLFLRESEQIRSDCEAALHDRCDDPYFVLGTCAADVGFGTPPENIHVFREAAADFARESPA